jgi:hypothetical protein
MSLQNPAAMPEPKPEATPLLEPIDAVTLPASSEPFVVRDRFEKSPSITFATVWTEFKKRFYGLVERPLSPITLRKYKLLRIAPDGPIIAELGGPDRVQGRIAALYGLLQRQGRGGDGILQTNGYANIFYQRDVKGVLCAIRVGWDGDGWVIDAIPVEDPLAWNGRHEIFCPDASASAAG